MKARVLPIAVAAVVLIAGGRILLGQRVPAVGQPGATSAPASYGAAVAPLTMRSTLPSELTAKTVLNSTSRHPEWTSVPDGSAAIRTFVVYPERADYAPVVLLTSNSQGLSDWMRAVGDQVASEGFIAIVPDYLTGLGPGGGDTEAFTNREAIAKAFARLGQTELQRRTAVVRNYATTHPAGNGRNAVLSVNQDAGGRTRIDATVTTGSGDRRAASFELTERSWPDVVAFLAEHTENRFVPVPEITMAHAHAAGHAGHAAMAQEPAGRAGGGGGDGGKRADLPGNWRSHQMALHLSPRRKEWVDIPFGDTKLRTFIAYPQNVEKAGVIVVMHGGPGLDTWNQGIADQLAHHGFIGVAPDLLSGLGPNGGNIDSFEFPDDVGRALNRLTPADMMRRYVAARDYALKQPQANGKSASVGFCLGGTNAWRFSAEPGVNAAVSFYGGQPDLATIGRIHAPVLAFFGQLDLGLAPRIAPATEQMKAAGKAFEVHVYEKGTHSFLNRQDLAENMKATEDSWPRAVAFLKQHLN